MPLASTRIVPRELDAVFTVSPEAAEVLAAGCTVDELVVPLELLPQAASSTPTARASPDILAG